MTLALKIPPPVQAIITAGLMWQMKVWQPHALHYQLPDGLCIAVAVLGLSCALMATLQFKRADTTINPQHPEQTSNLQITGIYRYSRNPMYLGLLLLLCSWAMWLGLFLNGFLLLLFVSYITTYQIIPEEQQLEKTFDDDYQLYCQQVRRWL